MWFRKYIKYSVTLKSNMGETAVRYQLQLDNMFKHVKQLVGAVLKYKC